MIRTALFAVVATVVMGLAGCRSTKPAAVVDDNRWTDLYVPVKLELTEPSKMSISGRATMVQGQSIYLSLRMIGMEVATVYVDADSIFATEKVHGQMIGVDFDRTLGRKLTVGELQRLLLGEPDAPVGKLPKALSYEVDRSANGRSVTVGLKVSAGRKTYAGRLIWDMGAAQYDTGKPREWRRPTDYMYIKPEMLPKILESL